MISYSMGAMISLTWAQRYPDWIDFLIIGSCCYRAYPTNLAWRQIQREIITSDPNWQDNHFSTGYKIARKIAMLNYRTSQELDQRFLGLRDEASLENYLQHNAEKFSKKTNIFSYLYTLSAMDQFDLVSGWPNRKTCFEKIKASTLLISVTSDVLYPPMQQEDLRDAFYEANRAIRYISHDSLVGHDAFIIDKTAIADYITEFFRF
jgi:homoserine O-acetyltransferase